MFCFTPVSSLRRSNPFSPVDQNQCLCKQCRSRWDGRLIRIYIVCHSVFDFRLKPQIVSVDKSKFKNGRVHFRNSGIKRLKACYKQNWHHIYPYYSNKQAWANSVYSDQKLRLAQLMRICDYLTDKFHKKDHHCRFANNRSFDFCVCYFIVFTLSFQTPQLLSIFYLKFGQVQFITHYWSKIAEWKVSHLDLHCLLGLSDQIHTIQYNIWKGYAQTVKIMTKPLAITNRLSIITAGLIIDYLFSSD